MEYDVELQDVLIKPINLMQTFIFYSSFIMITNVYIVVYMTNSISSIINFLIHQNVCSFNIIIIINT